MKSKIDQSEWQELQEKIHDLYWTVRAICVRIELETSDSENEKSEE